ncbi:FACT complex subunit ssrp1 [Coemansia sp. BCRC 34301]|nr:FACT complex subunit ssrp1 [Coemansia sp. BCRC 34301]
MSAKKLCRVTSEDSAELTEAYAKLSEVYMRMSNAMGGGGKRPPPHARDPNKPKRPMTGYLLFLQDKIPELKKEHPNATSSELFKLGGPAWTSLDENERRPFMMEAESLQSKYQDDKAKYESSQGTETDHPPVAAAKDETRPKKSKKPAITPAPPSVEKVPAEKVEKTKEKSRKAAAAAATEGSDAGAQPKKKKKSKDAKSSSD